MKQIEQYYDLAVALLHNPDNGAEVLFSLIFSVDIRYDF